MERTVDGGYKRYQQNRQNKCSTARPPARAHWMRRREPPAALLGADAHWYVGPRARPERALHVGGCASGPCTITLQWCTMVLGGGHASMAARATLPCESNICSIPAALLGPVRRPCSQQPCHSGPRAGTSTPCQSEFPGRGLVQGWRGRRPGLKSSTRSRSELLGRGSTGLWRGRQSHRRFSLRLRKDIRVRKAQESIWPLL